MRGYVLFFDEKESSSYKCLLQKKSYFQHFSVQRNLFSKQPVCGLPGQFTLPGGRMDPRLAHEQGTLAASLKQFFEESGVSMERLIQLKYSDEGYFTPCEGELSDSGTDMMRSMGVQRRYFVHLVKVDDVTALAEDANSVIKAAKTVNDNADLSAADKEMLLRELYASTGFNDDSAASYEVVPWPQVLERLETTLPFDSSVREEWMQLVRCQDLLINFFHETRQGGSDKMNRVLADPGRDRDWFVQAFQYFSGVKDDKNEHSLKKQRLCSSDSISINQ